MDAEARIARMEAEGLLTAAQARALRDGVRPAPIAAEPPRTPTFRRAATIAVLIVALAVALVLLFGEEATEVQNVAATLNEPEELGTMNRSLATMLTLVLLALPPLAVLAWSYNGLVAREEAVLSAWAQTESNFQRRSDLVPALVETVSRFLKHERDTLAEVTGRRAAATERLAEGVEHLASARARLVEAPAGGAPLEDQAALDAVSAAEAAMSREVAGFLAIAEDYPELRSADQFLELQAQLEGTENRINVARMRFNEAVREYNGAIRRLPQSLVANLGGFRRKAYFRAETDAARVPELEFE